MDERVLRAMTKWPNVPSVFGWLALDQRGRWRLDYGLVRNRLTIDAINRNYAGDAEGRWYYQNGPQRVYVDLDYTPWVYALDGACRLVTHTGLAVAVVQQVWFDDEDNLLLATEHGIGLVSDRDLDRVSENFCDDKGRELTCDTLMEKLAKKRTDGEAGFYLRWPGPLAIARIARCEVALRYGFVPRPRDSNGAK